MRFALIVALGLAFGPVAAQAQDAHGRTPLMAACVENYPGVVKILLDVIN